MLWDVDMPEIWIGVVVVGVIYLLSSIWLVVVHHKLGKSMSMSMKVVLWAGGIGLCFGLIKAILETLS